MSKILVVDDDQQATDAFTAVLRNFGYHATAASSGDEALESLGGPLPDLVILDVMMPGMNGLEVLRRIREDSRTADLPVVMYSALDDDDWQARAKHEGASGYWIKGGLDRGELEEMVRHYLPNPRTVETALA
jgi:CheY-like chemotaxis protein